MSGLSPLRGMDEFRHMLQRADVRAALWGKEFGRFNIVPFLERILSQTRPAEHTVFVGGPGFGMYGRPASARGRDDLTRCRMPRAERDARRAGCGFRQTGVDR